MENLPDLASLFEYGDPEGSEARFLDLAETPAIQEATPYFCELLTRLARTRGLQRRFDDAHATLNEAEALGCEDPSCLVRLPLERGRVYNSSGDRPAAEPCFLSAFAIASEHGLDELAVDAAHMMGIVETGEASLDWNKRAIFMAESSKDPKANKWLGSLYNNTAWTLHDSGDLTSALDMFIKAKAFRETQAQKRPIEIAEWCIARCLRTMGRLEEALERQTRLYEESGDPAGYGAEELGELNLQMGNSVAAKPHFAEAYEKLAKDPWLQANEEPRLNRLQELSK